MKYQVKFIEQIEDRDTVLHGGVFFPTSGEPVVIDSDKVEMSPWFFGNPSFEIEETNNETTETVNDDAAENRSDSGGSEDAGQVDQVKAVEVKPTRTRKAARK